MPRRTKSVLGFAVGFLLVAGVFVVGPMWGLMPAPNPLLTWGALGMGVLLLLLALLDDGK